MKSIYTQVRTIEEADALGHFILANGYEGVQNDSYRYCRMTIELAIEENMKHNRDFCYIGVNFYRLVVGKNRRAMRMQGSIKFIEKERIFRKLLTDVYLERLNNRYVPANINRMKNRIK